MTMDWPHFTPWVSLLGGLMIGAAATLLLLFNGKIAGISGILGELLKFSRADIGWRLAFIAGAVVAPLIYSLVLPLPAVRVDADTATLITAGLLVGLGTRYGSGCTSGHGICGLSRRSPRSLVATGAFMLAGFLTVYLVRHAVA
ncbi:MAG TPA: YeeE/YedE family protein [Telluria sp.]|jgi:hypothetical protein